MLPINPTNNIRIFISSTFNDMQDERNQLVKKTFPILRAHCEKVGLTFTEVDLRWGITNKEATEGKVLAICFDEIEQSRPYFIGILGDRYGWIPDSLPSDLSTSEPWLKEEKGKSVTELEILNGVLNNPEMANHAFFYFRKPAINAEKAKDAAKLLQLKNRIKSSGFPLKEGFSSPEELGLWIEEDFKEVIKPQIAVLEKINEIELAQLEANAHIQIQSTFFVKPIEQFKQLDNFIEHQNKNNSILLYEGETGMGKYTNLTNWFIAKKKENKKHLFIFYPTHAGGDFSKVDFMLRFLTQQLDAQLPPKDANRYELVGYFINAMKQATKTTPCTIIIPAIDQLSDAQTGRGIIWLPNLLPKGIKMIVSASNPAIIQHFEYRNVKRLHSEKLSKNSIKNFTKQFLSQYRKKLSVSLMDSIANSTIATIPLNMMIILEELRIYGNHEKLEETLNNYLTAKNTKELYLKVINRWENDFNTVHPDLVKDTLSCIFMTKAGHSEIELRAILGGDSLLPQAYWSPLYLAMYKWLTPIKGNLNIGNNAFKEAIIEKYLQKPENVIHAHQLTAHYFLNKIKNNKPGYREFTELPYALFYSNNYDGFIDFYANRDTLKEAWKYSSTLVSQYFLLPEKYENHHYTEIFNKEIIDADDYIRLQKEDVDYLITVASIFQTMGDNKEAILFWNMIAGVGQQTKNDAHFEIGISKLAFLEMQSGNIDKAIDMYNHLLQHYTQKSDNEGIIDSSNNLGLCFQSKNENEKALVFFEKTANYFSKTQNIPKLLAVLINWSNTLERLEQYQESEEILDQAETICKQLGDNVTLAILHDEKAILLRNKEDYKQALKLHNNAVELFTQINHVNKLVISLASRGKTHFEMSSISEGIEDYIFAIYHCLNGGMQQSLHEILFMLEESMKWNTLFWLQTGNKELLDQLYYELDEYSQKDDGLFEEASDLFFDIMDKSVAFANSFNKGKKP